MVIKYFLIHIECKKERTIKNMVFLNLLDHIVKTIFANLNIYLTNIDKLSDLYKRWIYADVATNNTYQI